VTDPEVTAILPVYNDRKALKEAVPAALHALSNISGSFELIIAEDGSADGSTELAQECEKQDTRIRLIHSDSRQGRGKALNRAIGDAKGNIVCYLDVDLATDMQHLKDLIDAIRNGYDIATGSRLLPESNIVRSRKREIASRGYNLLVRIVLGSKISDHQCGFKSFNREKVLKLIPSVQSNHWFWDTEILVRGQKAGYRVKEFPVLWREGQGTTVRRRDITEMGSAIFRLWWQIHVSKD
jgi:glycosyltransferase involved in cell wall biosynthesis